MFKRKFMMIHFLALFFAGHNVFAGQQKIYVQLPGPCYEVSGVDKDHVYLKSINKPCSNQIDLVPVDIDDSYQSAFVYIDGSFFKKQVFESYGLDDVRSIIDKGEKAGRDLNIPENRYSESGRTEAEKIFKKYQSPEYQERISKEYERLKSKVFSKQTSSQAPRSGPASGGSNPSGRVLEQKERVYIFISSSVPAETLRAYIADINKIGDPNIVMVMRGFIKGIKNIKPTQDYVAALQKKDPQCDQTREKCDMYAANLMVDPLLFRFYNVSQVPTIIYSSNVTLKDPVQSEGKQGNVSISDYYALTGDTSLEYALQSFYKETNKNSLKQSLERIRAGFYK